MTTFPASRPLPGAPLRILPLGGLGEIGKNMMVLECGEDIVIVDCGVQFPTEDMPGVDLIIPDVSYLVAQSHRVRGILITHGHEDHIGALPHVLPDLDVPVYAPRLAHGLITVKLNERRSTRDAVVHAVEPEQPVEFGDNFRATWFRVCHSIPDAMGICIETPWGSVIHTGDFKIDHTPVDGHTIDLPALAERGRNGVLLLFSDSTYAELPGYTPSEQIMSEALNRAVGDAPGRVIIATFASLISRIQQVITAAENHGRHVAFVGRSMLANVQMATEMGYLDALPGTIVPVRDVTGLPPDRVVLMTTGSQGEPTSALVRIANGESRDVELMEGDTVVISATPIPGNERAVSQTIDNLLRQGAHVLYDRIAPVHVHGHASQEELKLMLNLTRPRYFVPVHGEYRHLRAHAQLAWELGAAPDGIFVLEDGEILEIDQNGAAITGSIPAGPIYLDGATTMDTDSVVLRERRSLARDGVVIVCAGVDPDGELSGPIQVAGSGFMDPADAKHAFKRLAEAVEMGVSGDLPADDPDKARANIRKVARQFLRNDLNKRPMIIPVILDT
ncbi:MAG: ribonuclease J [Chloroflexota bacterium]|nr:ribonuclease J [Chloroflexota bacterium]MDE2961604.1 ribonuclease J [Chloroflexota bacterium]